MFSFFLSYTITMHVFHKINNRLTLNKKPNCCFPFFEEQNNNTYCTNLPCSTCYPLSHTCIIFSEHFWCPILSFCYISVLVHLINFYLQDGDYLHGNLEQLFSTFLSNCALYWWYKNSFCWRLTIQVVYQILEQCFYTFITVIPSSKWTFFSKFWTAVLVYCVTIKTLSK